jgi:hypothetical protein
MGSHGPVPDRRLQALKGEGRSRDYPRAVVTAPPKPPDLEPDAERLRDVIVPELERLRLVSRLDGFTMEALGATYARWKRHNGGHGYAALTNVLAKLGRDVGWRRRHVSVWRHGRAIRAGSVRWSAVTDPGTSDVALIAVGTVRVRAWLRAKGSLP